MKNEIKDFFFDKEGNVTTSLASILDKNGWEVVACHPPGGHTSFSMLDGRRSKGGYMPDIVAIKYFSSIDDYFVVLVESKKTAKDSDKDIQKLINLNENHVAWVAFRLQNHLNSKKWLNNYNNKLQKIVAYDEGFFLRDSLPNDMIALQISEKKIIKNYIGEKSPLKKLLPNETFPNE